MRIGIVLGFLLTPVAAVAQDAATIAGVVKDASGGVLPGVTVEAASPVLLEKVRSVTTDGAGQYNMVALPPGTYSVTFTLPGFSVVRRESVQLTAAVTATMNVELRVGTLEETVTVTGESPIVDVRSARRQQVIDGDLLQSLPTSRSYNNVLQMAPGVLAGNGQAQLRPAMLLFSAHGGNAQDGRLTLDGINTGASRGGAGVSGYIPDMQNAQEVTFSISGNLGEAETGGPQMTIIPKAGGNDLSGSVLFSGLNDKMQGNNYDDEQLSVLGRFSPTLLLRDYQASVGGPIKRDRIWFFFNYRAVDSADAQPGIFANKNAGDPTKWTYEPDLTRQGRIDNHRRIASLRLTTQLTPRNKLMVFWDEQPNCAGAGWTDDDHCNSNKEGWIYGGSQTNGFFGPGPNSPETGDYASTHQRIQQVKYTGTATSRLLLEAGFGTYISQWGYSERPGNPTRSLVRVQEQSAQFFDADGNRVSGAAPGGLTVAGGLKYRSSNWPTGYIFAHTWGASASYVTGSHNMKVGYQGAFHRDDDNLFNIITNDERMTYRFNNGVPNRITIQAGAWTRKVRTEYAAFFIQDQWTRERLTLQGAVRYDRAWSHFPEQVIGPDKFIPTAIVVPADTGVNAYNDISPRVGFAYDLLGNGKTSLKGNIGKYMHPASNAGRFTASNPSERMVTIVDRAWVDGNGNYLPDCDLLNGAPQNNLASGGDSCGVWINPNFGRAVPTTTLAPNLLSGWGNRPNDWQFGISIQQEIVPRVSAEIGYYRRWWPIYDSVDIVDNILVSPSDYGQFSVRAPSDPRLPDGGGYLVSGLYNINPDAVGRAENVRHAATDYGDYSRHWDGFDVTFQARLRNGLTVHGGTSTGRLAENFCDVRPQAPEGLSAAPFGGANGPSSLLNPYCDQTEPLRTTYKANASYLVPRIDVQLSGTFSSRPGAVLRADAIFSANDPTIRATLGRPLAQVPNVTVPLIGPYERFGDRIDQLDVRLGKLLRFGRTRTNVSLDVVNLFNSNDNLAYGTLFNATWPAPTQVLLPRIFRINASFDF
jgi:outer membrane receptor protein involved in Fe transport